jgi:hypothetical protein
MVKARDASGMSQHPSILIALAEDRRRILAELATTSGRGRRPSLLSRMLRRRPPAPAAPAGPAPSTEAGACC